MTHVIATLLEDSMPKLTVPWPTAAFTSFSLAPVRARPWDWLTHLEQRPHSCQWDAACGASMLLLLGSSTSPQFSTGNGQFSTKVLPEHRRAHQASTRREND